jgi:MtN3 and saliva related transmembrane protein
MMAAMPHKASNHRVRQKPAPKTHKLIRQLVLSMAIIEPLMTMPQIYEIWIRHQVAGVSLATWGFYLIAAVIWTLYGFQIKDKPVIISSILWVITEGMVVVGILVNKF